MTGSSRIMGSKYVLTLMVLCVFIFCHGNTDAQTEKKNLGKFYVIGTGPAGPEHATCKAIEYIKKADVVFCSADVSERFSMYLKGKKMGGEPWRGDFKYKWKDLETLGPEIRKACREERIEYWNKTVASIKKEMNNGRTVALLDSGDPCIFGPSHRIIEGFDPDEVEIIPGLGCFQAAMTALKKSSIPAYDTRFLMLTAPFFLLGKPENEEILKDLSKYPITMGLYMALKDADRLINKLKKYYPHDLPAAVVYNAGYPEKEKVFKGTLDTILNVIKSQKEKWMGMLIIG
ncbi:MAG: SAM-dependent methyltransferase, partial [Thermodesulfobacteriota bacterium]|nr:SAM-dependent methyltransferase [Thermodesulfobacteriota bacterium]